MDASGHEWLSTVPPAMRDGLTGVARAVAGMSEAEKKGTANWFLKHAEDTKAPPAIRAFSQAAFSSSWPPWCPRRTRGAKVTLTGPHV